MPALVGTALVGTAAAVAAEVTSWNTLDSHYRSVRVRAHYLE